MNSSLVHFYLLILSILTLLILPAAHTAPASLSQALGPSWNIQGLSQGVSGRRGASLAPDFDFAEFHRAPREPEVHCGNTEIQSRASARRSIHYWLHSQHTLALGSKENGSHVRWKTGQDRPKPPGPDCTQNRWAPLAPGSPLRLGPSVAFVPVQVRDAPRSVRSAAAPLPRAALRSLSSLLRYFSG